MKNKLLKISLLFLISLPLIAQYNNVNPTNRYISENLDLRAVASIFGDSYNLEDFEKRLNDPRNQISNLDLNEDNNVDYLRVIESVEQYTHLVIIQAVLSYNTYQDVATIDIDRDQNNNLQVQLIGNNFIYGPNYIYEPFYQRTPAIFVSLFSTNYRPYVSSWRWNYYPKAFRTWNPCPIAQYRNNVEIIINTNNRYNYVNYRKCSKAVVLYQSRCSNSYERLHPEYHFSTVNRSYVNHYELENRVQPRYSTSNYSNKERFEENFGRYTDPNRYEAYRSGTSLRTENTRGSYNNNKEINPYSNPQINDNRRNYATDGTSGTTSETRRPIPQSNADYSSNNTATTREKYRQSNENFSRRDSNSGERQNQSSPNTRRRI